MKIDIRYSKIILALVFFSLISLNLHAKFNYRQFLRDRKARSEFNQGNYEEAERLFRENAIENPNQGTLHFNRGNALYKTNQFEDAQNEYQLALNDRNFTNKDEIFHNMGNVAFQSEEYEKALELYRRALIENQNNIDARKNYELTRLILNQQESDGGGGGDGSDDEQEEQQSQSSQAPAEQDDQEKQDATDLLQALEQKQEQEKEQEPIQSGVRRGNYW